MTDIASRPHDTMSTEILEVDHLIVGAGPAGASLACFLGKYGKCLYDTADVGPKFTFPIL
jgi:thioredoxin reductase